MPSRTFFRLARQLPTYQGAMAARLQREEDEGTPTSHQGEVVTEVNPDQFLQAWGPNEYIS